MGEDGERGRGRQGLGFISVEDPPEPLRRRCYPEDCPEDQHADAEAEAVSGAPSSPSARAGCVRWAGDHFRLHLKQAFARGGSGLVHVRLLWRLGAHQHYHHHARARLCVHAIVARE